MGSWDKDQRVKTSWLRSILEWTKRKEVDEALFEHNHLGSGKDNEEVIRCHVVAFFKNGPC